MRGRGGPAEARGIERGAGPARRSRLCPPTWRVTWSAQDGGARRDLLPLAAAEPLAAVPPGAARRRSALRRAGLRYRRAGDAHGAGERAGPRREEEEGSGGGGPGVGAARSAARGGRARSGRVCR